jgi:hypothetical protein
MLSIKVMLINYGKFIRSGSSMLIGQVCLSKVMLIERFYCTPLKKIASKFRMSFLPFFLVCLLLSFYSK